MLDVGGVGLGEDLLGVCWEWGGGWRGVGGGVEMRGVLWVGGNGCGWFLRLCVERMLCTVV